MSPCSSPRSLLSDPATQSSFKWSPSGDSVLITDTNHFTSQVLPLHFRHNQLSSFVRQLNKHGFKRIKQHVAASGNSSNNVSSLKSTSLSNGSDVAIESSQVPLEYQHPSFTRNDRASWHLIRWNTGGSSGSVTSPQLQDPASPAVSLRLDAMAEQNDYVYKQVENAENRLNHMESALAAFNQRIAKQALLIDKLSQLLPSGSSAGQFQHHSSMHPHHQQYQQQHQMEIQHQQQQQQQQHMQHQMEMQHMHHNPHKRSLDTMQEDRHLQRQLQAFDFEAAFQPDTTFINISANSRLPEYNNSTDLTSSSNNQTNASGPAMPSLMQG